LTTGALFGTVRAVDESNPEHGSELNLGLSFPEGTVLVTTSRPGGVLFYDGGGFYLYPIDDMSRVNVIIAAYISAPAALRDYVVAALRSHWVQHRHQRINKPRRPVGADPASSSLSPDLRVSLVSELLPAPRRSAGSPTAAPLPHRGC
jgi:hypothetical protein